MADPADAAPPLPPRRLVIWCNARFDPQVTASLKDGTGDHDLLLAAAGEELSPRAEVAFGQPDPAAVRAAPRLAWVQITSAGFTRYDTPEVRQALAARGAVLTNASGVYDDPCAQHVLAMMLAAARGLPRAWDEQRGPRGWPAAEIRRRAFLLTGQRVTIAGYGAIGRRLAELLAPLGMAVTGIRRQVRGDEGPASVRVVTEAGADAALADADHVVNVLPANGETAHYFNAARINRMKSGAYFYNVGRGSTVDQQALRAALADGRLAGAYLDVTDPEPLPPDHPLWQTPNCWITPHAAGGHVGESARHVRHFLDNLARFTGGQPLRDIAIR